MSDKSVILKEVECGENAALYSIKFSSESETEFEKFISKFKDNAVYNEHYNSIIFALKHIMEVGAFERYFRNEGGDIKALGLDSKNLRLYCLRLSDSILIIGNGGVKTTRTYQESEELNGYVMNLKAFNKMLKSALKKDEISIKGLSITGIESKEFDL